MGTSSLEDDLAIALKIGPSNRLLGIYGPAVFC